MNQASILVVDDDRELQRLLGSQLGARGYAVRTTDNGPDALLAAAQAAPDLVLLDLTMRGMDGLEVCRRLREWSAVPVILLTATDTPETKVSALDLGADDYLTKPFHMVELLARIRAVLRRVAGGDKAAGVLETGGLTVDLMRREVRRGEKEIHLTRIEFDLLRELAIHAGQVLTYGHLLNAVWGPGCADPHLVHVHVSNLRRKLERGAPAPEVPAAAIRAAPGVGYRFRPGA